jgi:hypothetical protein
LRVSSSLTSSLWLGFSCGDRTATAPTAPSLRAARPEGLTTDVLVDPHKSQASCFLIFSLHLSLSVAGVPTCPALLTPTLLVVSSSTVSAGAYPSTESNP